MARSNSQGEHGEKTLDWEYSSMILGVPWRENDRDSNTDGGNLKVDVVMMDKDYTESLEEVEYFGFTAKCP